VASYPFRAKTQVVLEMVAFLEGASFPLAFPSASCLEVAFTFLPLEG